MKPNGIAIKDSLGGYSFGHQMVRSADPILHNKLLNHKAGTCGIANNHKPYRLNRHIVICPTCNLRLGSLRGTDLSEFLKDERQLIDTCGILGFGGFGQFLGRHLATEYNVFAYDIADKSESAEQVGVDWATLEKVVAQDMLVLALPFKVLESVLKNIVGFVPSKTLIMDVCSVKQKPLELIDYYFPNNDVLATHPLFGPQSAKGGLHLHKVVVCPAQRPSVKADFLKQQMSTKFGLELVECGAKEHDEQMAMVQGLTHFVARALKQCGVGRSHLATKSFEALCQSMELLGLDSWDLFKTIELGNSYAAGVRQNFVKKLIELEERLKE